MSQNQHSQPEAPQHASEIAAHQTCPQCEALTSALVTAEREYANARGWLGEMEASPDAYDYHRIRRVAEQTRLDYELARLELEQHRQTFHGLIN